MELCPGGSLYNILDQSDNYYGLKEREFIRVLTHISKMDMEIVWLGREKCMKEQVLNSSEK